MALMRWLTPLTLREIGDVFNKRSPACVHFAQSRVRALKEEEPRVRALIEAALRRFRRPRQS
jgi:chromosomal replication initiation ATPase DnaA